MNATNTHCDNLKALLVERGEFDPERERERHPDLAAHVVDCAACQRLLAAWSELPGLLDELPEHEPDDALVDRVRESVSSTPASTPRRRYLAPSLATAAVLLAAVGISHELLMRETPRAPLPAELRAPAGEPRSETGGFGGRFDDESEAAGKEREQFRRGQNIIESEEEVQAQTQALDRLADVPADERSQDKPVAEESAAQRTREIRRTDDLDALVVTGSRIEDADGEVRSDRAGPDRLVEKAAPEPAVPAAPPPALYEQIATRAWDFFAHYTQVDGIAFQPATGYWANTHVPGDPAMRLLSARLAQQGHDWLAGGKPIERTVQPIPQPFDAPDDHALALSLMADAAAIPAGEPTRFRLQVGIQGIEHRHGERPAMNLGVVVDLPPDAADTTRIAARVLIDALLEARRAGDRFALIVTGERGVVIEPDDFRYGPLQLAKGRILGREDPAIVPGDAHADLANTETPDAVGRMSLDTYHALERAGDLVAADEDPGRPLGSSAIVLIGARELTNLDDLLDLTHAHATDGITTSVFPLGNGPTSEQAERLVLAGLGNRRILERPAEARGLVEDELHASSRAVARAARLSIRLAPGVKLVDVIGSERLDAPEAQRVREVENAMDRRLAADLGIAADRGRDEDGIQVVIPAIHAGDSAVILLDLVTDRPGPIAEVTLRYKDLVNRRNGSLAAQLTLPRADTAGAAERGPVELVVLKNLLAHHFTEAVEQAADAVGRGDPARAAALLHGMHATIAEARRDLPAWADDPDLARDQQVLERYLAALKSPQALTHPSLLADSLRLAAYAKQHGLPDHWK